MKKRSMREIVELLKWKIGNGLQTKTYMVAEALGIETSELIELISRNRMPSSKKIERWCIKNDIDIVTILYDLPKGITKEMIQDKEVMKLLYWTFEMPSKRLAELVGMSTGWVDTWIRKHDLSKAKHGIKYRGKKGYQMPSRDKAKRMGQPHAKRVLMKDLETGKVIREFESMQEAHDHGYHRGRIRDVYRRKSKQHQGYDWEIKKKAVKS